MPWHLRLPRWWWWGLPIAAVIYAILAYVFPSIAAGMANSEDPGGSLAGLFLGTISQAFAPFAPVLFLMYWVREVRQAVRDSSRLDRQTGIDSICDLPWREFEDLLAEAYRRKGFRVDKTPVGPDGGVDLVLNGDGVRLAVQAKHWQRRAVGVSVVRELLGAVTATRADGAILVTSGSVSEAARTLAAGNGIEIVESGELVDLIRSVQPDGKRRPTPVRLGAEPPPCPSCRSPMVRRVAHRGARKGQPFWGCSRFPVCRGIIDSADEPEGRPSE